MVLLLSAPVSVPLHTAALVPLYTTIQLVCAALASVFSVRPSTSEQTTVPAQVQLASTMSLTVYGLPSSQGSPCTPGKFGQLSFVSQRPSPSLSGMGVKTQPIAGSQASLVQGSPSSQLTICPPEQVQLASSTSPVVQALPSLQGSPIW